MHCLFRYTQFTSGLAFNTLNTQESLNTHNQHSATVTIHISTLTQLLANNKLKSGLLWTLVTECAQTWGWRKIKIKMKIKIIILMNGS